MPQRPAYDVAQFLAAAGLGLTYETNLYDSTERAPGDGVPVNAVFVFETIGAPPDRNNDVRVEHRFPHIHIRIRNNLKGPAEQLASSIIDALQGANIPGYEDIRSLGSNFGPSFEARSGLNRLSMSFELVYSSDVRV